MAGLCVGGGGVINIDWRYTVMSSYRGVLSIIIVSYFKKDYLIATIDEPNS